MAFKTIAAFIDASAYGRNRITYAVRLALQHHAHLLGIFVPPFDWSHDPSESYARGSSAIREIIQRHDVEKALAEQDARAVFEDAARRDDVSCEFRALRTLDAVDHVSLHSLHADLVIVGHPWPGGLPQSWSPEAMLFAAGVPLLIVPDGCLPRSPPDNIIVAWNVSSVARRAIADALPLLSAARSVHVVTVNPDMNKLHGEEPGADIGLYLSRHGVNITVEAVQSAEKSVAEAISEYARSGDYDLIVLGAYGHSRSRELIFGGVTRSLLRTVPVPLFISH
jgi:nucleotide-binding universal stress UspA family protein